MTFSIDSFSRRMNRLERREKIMRRTIFTAAVVALVTFQTMPDSWRQVYDAVKNFLSGHMYFGGGGGGGF